MGNWIKIYTEVDGIFLSLCHNMFSAVDPTECKLIISLMGINRSGHTDIATPDYQICEKYKIHERIMIEKYKIH